MQAFGISSLVPTLPDVAKHRFCHIAVGLAIFGTGHGQSQVRERIEGVAHRQIQRHTELVRLP